MAGDDVEHFQQQETLGRRARLVHGVLAVGGGDGFADVGIVAGEIGFAEEAAIGGGLVDSGDEPGGEVAAVVGVGTALSHAADGVGEVRVG